MKHGQCKNGVKTRIYRIWADMNDRILNPNATGYENYGGRGIKICEEWRNPVIFMVWAVNNGYDSKLELDRIDNNGNYEPGNCRFVTHKINQLNRRRRENFLIEKRFNNFRVRVKRDNQMFYGGSVPDLQAAIVLRTELLNRLNN